MRNRYILLADACLIPLVVRPGTGDPAVGATIDDGGLDGSPYQTLAAATTSWWIVERRFLARSSRSRPLSPTACDTAGSTA